MTEQKIEALLSHLTLDEKLGMIHGAGLFRTEGVERLHIPPLILSDGPMGVRNDFPDDSWVPVGNNDDYVTYLPSNSALASTWNRNLAFGTGKVLGEESRGRGKDVILAPGINIKRSPLCGRNFEYMSEDPYLAGEMAVPYIEGIQTADTAACVKHFALNNQETERLWVEVEASERALREIYLPAFKKAVQKANSYSLMGAYNRYRGEHCCESKVLLNQILRKEWGYDGMVVSDWGGVHRTKEAAESGLDIEMSVTYDFEDYKMANPLKKAIEGGEIPESLVDEKVRNILRLMYRLHMLDGETRSAGSYNTPEHRQSALETARESIVLLKNENNLLPLKREKVKEILIIGDNANRIHSNGGGSAEIKALYEISPLMGIKMLLGGNAQVRFVQGYDADDVEKQEEAVNWQAESLENGGGSTGQSHLADAGLLKKQARLREEAVTLAQEYDTVIFVGGQNHQQDLEGHDRPDMELPYAQDELIKQLLQVKPDTIVVLVSGSPVEMPWIRQAKTLVWSWFAGMEGGTALAEVLFGQINPSGRLPETFPVCHMDCPAHCIGEFPGAETVRYAEDIFVGYRYYDTKHVPVLFPFGYGLSYTEFVYDRLNVVLNDSVIQISLEVTNVGETAGKEVVQIYTGKKDSCVERPVKELKAFTKVALDPGETKNVFLEISREDLAYYDEVQKQFVTEPGTYQIYAARSVLDIHLQTECRIEQ